MLSSLYNWFYHDFSLDKISTDMEVMECAKCKIWIPQERAPTRKRKNKVIKLDTCRPCKKHLDKCRLSKSDYY